MATLNAQTLPTSHYASERYEVQTAGQYRSGESQALITDDPAAGTRRYGWRLGWRLLTSGQRDTLRTIYETYGTMAYAPDNTTGGPFTVQIMRGTWDQSLVMIAGGGIRYTVHFDVEE